MTEMIMLAIIAVLLGGILMAVKTGFNEVIKGLEAVDQRLAAKR